MISEGFMRVSFRAIFAALTGLALAATVDVELAWQTGIGEGTGPQAKIHSVLRGESSGYTAAKLRRACRICQACKGRHPIRQP